MSGSVVLHNVILAVFCPHKRFLQIDSLSLSVALIQQCKFCPAVITKSACICNVCGKGIGRCIGSVLSVIGWIRRNFPYFCGKADTIVITVSAQCSSHFQFIHFRFTDRSLHIKSFTADHLNQRFSIVAFFFGITDCFHHTI